MNAIIIKNLDNIKTLCRQYKVKFLYIFGSVCTDKFDEHSDIDILISFNDIPINEYADNYFILHEKFENLFFRKIDLLTDKMISNPYFIKMLNKTKTLLYEG
ncbi:MAG: nucleotidyltransferase domain-containing protein [Bacteroidia bacterium]|nr:nucleotidyltransferase domain-containing protein [Bacteroidia bacterium]